VFCLAKCIEGLEQILNTMILIKNSQRKIKFDVHQFNAAAQKILNLLNYADYDLGIWLTTNKTIHYYNKTYRHKDRPTDILSFAYHPKLKAGQRIRPQSEEDKNLGDLIISLEYVQKAASALGITFEQRMRMLLVHGICHLLGYDHIKDEDYKIMHRKELTLLRQLKN
jgi:probable rRNA maturation factor